MSTAQSIDFLYTPAIDDPIRFDWHKLTKLPFVRTIVQPKASVESMMAVEGGFTFEHRPVFTLRSGMATGLIGTLVFSLIGTAIATGVLTPKSVANVFESASSYQVRADYMPRNASSQFKSNSQEDAVSAKPIPPSKSVATSAPSASQTDQATPKLKKTVFGFLPYWFVDSAVGTIDYNLLSTLAYFDIGMNADGSFDTNTPGWSKLHDGTTQGILNDARRANTRVVLTFTAFDSGTIEALAYDAAAGDQAISNMINLVKEQKAGGANIDFEYIDEASGDLRAAYTRFVQRATERFHADIPGSEVTVSTYAASAKYQKMYEVAPLANVSDGLFIMGYDYYTVNSDNAGPIAPLTGNPGVYWYDISSAVADHLAAGVPADKMILGVPYYGYDWPTVDHSPKSQVLPGHANTATYSAVKKAISQGIGERRWDYEAQVPYLVYSEDGVQRIAYYDDAESLGKKYDLINDKNLKGAGIWALGQDGGAKELWQLLEEKFGNGK